MTMSQKKDITSLDSRAALINALMKKIPGMTKSLLKSANALAQSADKIDQDLKNFIVVLGALEGTEEGVDDLRKLRTQNGLNLRLARGIAGHVGRIQDISGNEINVS